jgi:hypothetical protein
VAAAAAFVSAAAFAVPRILSNPSVRPDMILSVSICADGLFL